MIEVIRVAGFCGPANDDTYDIYDVNTVKLDIQAYELLDSAPQALVEENPDSSTQEEEVPQARVTILPNKALDGLWSR